MNITSRRKKRHNDILAVTEDARTTNNGVLGTDWKDIDLHEMVEDCTGYKLTDVERRLAVVGYSEGIATAKKSIWYN